MTKTYSNFHDLKNVVISATPSIPGRRVTIKNPFTYYSDGIKHIVHSKAINRIAGKRDLELDSIEGYYEVTNDLLNFLLDVCSQENIYVFKLELSKGKKTAITEKKIVRMIKVKSWTKLPKEVYAKILKWSQEFNHSLMNFGAPAIYYRKYLDDINVIGKKFYLRMIQIGHQIKLILESFEFSLNSPEKKEMQLSTINLTDELFFIK